MQLTEMFRSLPAFGELCGKYKDRSTVLLASSAGSAFGMMAAAVAQQLGGVHVVVMEDRDKAAYMAADLYALAGEERVMFFPTAYKRSIQFGQEDPSGIVQRTAALGAVRNFSPAKGEFLILCTWPEALLEKVVDRDRLQSSTIVINQGDKLPMKFVEEALQQGGFERVDFVSDPGQYAVRGGIIDLFSYAANHPHRLDFFGDQVDSIRPFKVSTQLSEGKVDRVEVVPNLKRIEGTQQRVSFARFAAGASYWVEDLEYTLQRFNSIRSKILADLDEPHGIENMVTSRRGFLEDTAENKIYLLNDRATERVADSRVELHCAPQPSFNKQFELLADDIVANKAKGYKTYILSENRAQTERLDNTFHSRGKPDAEFFPLQVTLHEGFINHDLKTCFYTDHQIFDRYHRYRLRGELDRSESLTIAELNTLQIGDYVPHIDHGVGRFGGLVRTTENGKSQEAIKLVYRDGDVLLVNVHALHRIARYKSKEADAPKIYKLGSGAWQKMKEATKKSVKDIARELIALYAARKASGGFRFSPDTFLQQELEASFQWEETPDQQTAIEAVKHDMESPRPMDRLVCGDVGFGKTEVAVRAAFKAVADSRQVAILVPTTILSLQHYRTFSERLRDFPVRIEHLSRTKSAKETRAVLDDLKAGKIDILIGTHKILGKEVQFKSLGLLIIDEEQKFGVSAKEKLRQLSISVDTLTMTATPIPRTLQFSLMGSRDLSVITTPPPNRQPITTESHVYDEQLLKEAIEFELSRHGQVYVVHNRVDDIKRVEATVKNLCPGVRTAVGHGQMNPQEMEKVVMDFIYGEYDVLIATTIIENGIDIPNANTIIIDNAQNFGLGELHQLRGRVGRSNRKAFCYLFSPPDEMLGSEARRRLRALEEFSDLGSGFNIAMQDLDIRGAGNLLGAEQSGFIADIGFETYQKILAEAMDELRAEGLAVPGKESDREHGEVSYLSDCYIEVDTEALLPDDYIGQSVEKIRLYRQLDSISKEEELEKFADELKDRFGPLPEQVVELFNVIRLRRECVAMGFERAKVKNGLLILQFIADGNSPYYKSPLFMAVLKHVTENPAKFNFRQNNNKLSLTVREVKTVSDAVAALGKIHEAARAALPATQHAAE